MISKNRYSRLPEERKNFVSYEQKGLSCPQCHFFIPVAIDMLLSGSLTCSACNLILRLNIEESKEALEGVKKIYQAVENAGK